jgi:hypothetical protein
VYLFATLLWYLRSLHRLQRALWSGSQFAKTAAPSGRACFLARNQPRDPHASPEPTPPAPPAADPVANSLPGRQHLPGDCSCRSGRLSNSVRSSRSPQQWHPTSTRTPTPCPTNARIPSQPGDWLIVAALFRQTSSAAETRRRHLIRKTVPVPHPKR